MSTSQTSSYSIIQWQTRKCGNKYIYCNGDCVNCENAEVLFSNKSTTNNDGFTIHIVKQPG